MNTSWAISSAHHRHLAGRRNSGATGTAASETSTSARRGRIRPSNGHSCPIRLRPLVWISGRPNPEAERHGVVRDAYGPALRAKAEATGVEARVVWVSMCTETSCGGAGALAGRDARAFSPHSIAGGGGVVMH